MSLRLAAVSAPACPRASATRLLTCTAPCRVPDGHVWTHIEAIYAALLAHQNATGSLPAQLFLPAGWPAWGTGKVAGFAEAARILSTAEMRVHRVPWVPVCGPAAEQRTTSPPKSTVIAPNLCCAASAWPLPSSPPSGLAPAGWVVPPSGIRMVQLNVGFAYAASFPMRWSLRRHVWRALGIEHGPALSAPQPRPHSSAGCDRAPLPTPNRSHWPEVPRDTAGGGSLPPRLFMVVLSGNSSNERRIHGEAEVVAALRNAVEERNAAARRAAVPAVPNLGRGAGGQARRAGRNKRARAAAAAADVLEFVTVDVESMSLEEEVCGG